MELFCGYRRRLLPSSTWKRPVRSPMVSRLCYDCFFSLGLRSRFEPLLRGSLRRPLMSLFWAADWLRGWGGWSSRALG